MGARAGLPGRGRGRGPMGARVGIVPPDLLSVGVVETSRPAPEPVIAESVPDLPLTGEDALSVTEAPPPPTRKRATRARKSARGTGEAGEGDKSGTKRSARKGRSKTASE